MKKDFRLKSNEDFSNLVHKGEKIKLNTFNIYYLDNGLLHSRFGISVSTKLGNAVIRNKTKRQIRTILDEFIENNKTPLDILIVVKENYFLNNYLTNKRILLESLNKLEK